MSKIEEIFAKIDQLFEENQPSKARDYMLSELECATKDGDLSLQLQLLNELIGYYRQVSQKDALQKTIKQALVIAEEMGLKGSIPYATTLLNAATGMRSIGELTPALLYYNEVETIYRDNMPNMDLRMAGFLNNKSLLLQELQSFEEAYECEKRALEIAQNNQAMFEIGVSYANLSNTCVGLRRYHEAIEYANKALEVLASRNVFDGHYCAALSAIGLCLLAQQKFEEASEYFLKGMKLVEQAVGKNAQYKRLEENYRMCVEAMGETSKKGLDICRKYYETYGKTMIHDKFPQYEDKIAVGLVGEGSDCFGFDDATSKDHDWGPGFCMWVNDRVYEEIGEMLQKEYDNLPKEFEGYTRRNSPQGEKRLGVHKIADFYENFIGTCDISAIDYRIITDYALATAVNGVVFLDKEGTFTQIREKLMLGYPEPVLYLKLAEAVGKLSQSGQYNFERMWKRGDYFTAERMLSDCMMQAFTLLHYINQKYPPHDKWLKESTLLLEDGEYLVAKCEELRKCLHTQEKDTCAQLAVRVEEICSFLANTMYNHHLISDVDPFLGNHLEELLQKASWSKLSDDDLIEAIVKLEFTAFDKVQNEGGRASCQNNWPTFHVMRKSQYMTWNRTMLLQYYFDFNREFNLGHNLITEKYGRMMESTAKERYEEIKEHFPSLSEQKKAVIEQIVAIQMEMMEAFAEKHPGLASNARSLHTYEDNIINTSYETYLRGEISTYSDKMLQLYGAYVVENVTLGKNIARETIENTVKLYGYTSMEQLEKFMNF